MTLDKNKNWKEIQSLSLIVDYILSTYHEPLKTDLEEIPSIIESAIQENPHNSVLEEIQSSFSEVKNILVNHLFKEENILFPMMKELDIKEKTQEPLEEFHCGSIANPIKQMEYEHQNLDDELALITRMTDNYSTPANASIAYQQLMYRLSDLDVELRKHADLEDSVLHPLAIKKEKELQ